MSDGTIKEGWILRVYAKNLEDVAERAERVLAMIGKIRTISLVAPIVVMVPSEKDCGEIVDYLKHAIGSDELISIRAIAGSPNIELLNYGLGYLSYNACTHAIIVSNKAIEAVTEHVLSQINRAFALGAKAVGVALGDLAPIVLEGRIQNTFAAYEISAAIECGGFSYEHPEDGGVEEISLQLALLKRFDRCFAVIRVRAKLDVANVAGANNRHATVLNTKRKRQNDLLRKAGETRPYLRHDFIVI